MLSDLDAVILAMANRNAQLAESLKTENTSIETRPAVSATPIPRPKGARVRFIPLSSMSKTQ